MYIYVVVRSRCGLDGLATPSFHFSKFGSTWEYYQVSTVNDEKMKRIRAVCIVILATNFSPAKYSALLSYMTSAFLENGSTLSVMRAYLSVFTSGKVERESSEGPQSFTMKAFQDKRALISEVKPIFSTFGMETVLIWVAILLKKRIFVHSSSVSQLMSVVRSFPLIGGWHRQSWDIIRPLVSASDASLELKDLEAAGVYVAGFTDANAADLESHYDLYCDFTNSTITVAPHAQADFRLARFHQQTITAFLKATEAGDDASVIKVMAQKTKELLDTLKKLCVQAEDESLIITMENLAERGLPPNMDTFLFNVARAEGLTQR